MHKYEIRPMEKKDCKALYELEQQCFLGTSAWDYNSILEILNYDTNIYFVCYEEEELVGYIGLMVAADEGSITNVAVSPNRRRRGIADALIERVIKAAREKNVTQIFLEVRKTNAPAISLYEKHGFSYIGCRKNYYDEPKEDANIMCILL
ncbi:MAG: ribosomal protein S18-alanine N-acetyltransferase [Lachnospiraceae bacterium]